MDLGAQDRREGVTGGARLVTRPGQVSGPRRPPAWRDGQRGPGRGVAGAAGARTPTLVYPVSSGGYSRGPLSSPRAAVPLFGWGSCLQNGAAPAAVTSLPQGGNTLMYITKRNALILLILGIDRSVLKYI